MRITWAHRIVAIAKIWAVFRYHIMVCRPHFTDIIRMQVKCQANVCHLHQAVAFHPHNIIIRQQQQQVAMVVAVNKEIIQQHFIQATPMLRIMLHLIQINRHHSCCPLNCTKVFLPMLFSIVPIKCVHIHFRAIYYFRIQTNRPIHLITIMMKSPPSPLRLVWCVMKVRFSNDFHLNWNPKLIQIEPVSKWIEQCVQKLICYLFVWFQLKRWYVLLICFSSISCQYYVELIFCFQFF